MIRNRIFYGWIIVGLAFLIGMFAFGSRFAFGLFMPWITEALDTTVAGVSLTFAMFTLLSGLFQPITGLLADRFGPQRVILVGLVLLGLALIGSGLAQHLWQMMLFLGLLGGLGFSAISFVITSSLVSRWFDRLRGRALGVINSGNMVGQFLIVPITGALILTVGWRWALVVLGLLLLALVPLVWRYAHNSPESVGLRPDGERPAADGSPEGEPKSLERQGTKAPAGSVPLALVMRDRSFWLLAVSLFGCGFMMNLIFFHLPSIIINYGYGPVLATASLTIMGGLGIVGIISVGTLSDWFSRKAILSSLYMTRVVVTLLLILVPGLLMIYAFAVVFGLFARGTMVLTSGIIGDIFGRYSVAKVLGWIFLSHQVGGALGTAIGGLAFDMTGSYVPALIIGIGVSVLSSILAFLVSPCPHAHLAAAPAVATTSPTASSVGATSA